MAELSHSSSSTKAQCFRCRRWGHLSRECTKKVNAAMSQGNEQSGTCNLQWDVLHGHNGNNDCEVEIDSAADTSIVAKDLLL